MPLKGTAIPNYALLRSGLDQLKRTPYVLIPYQSSGGGLIGTIPNYALLRSGLNQLKRTPYVLIPHQSSSGGLIGTMHKEIIEFIPLSANSVSQHLKTLCNAQILVKDSFAGAVGYRVNDVGWQSAKAA